MDVKRVIDEALRLPPEARAALAGELLASLEDAAVDSEREAAWSAEIHDRLEAWQRGDVPSLSEAEFFGRLEETVRGKPTP